MPVLISPSLADAPYLPALEDDLVATSSTACRTSASTTDFLQVVKTFCYVGQCGVGGVECADKLTLIVDARDAAVLKGLTYLLQSPQTSSRPRVLLISSVQTWAGSKSASAAVASSDASSFWNRLPLTGEYGLYSTENQYATFLLNDKLPGFELCIVPVGLVYGGSGGDLAPAFDALWKYDKNTHKADTPVLKIKSLTAGTNSVPLVHQAALGKTLSKLCNARTVPLFLPAAGGDSGDLMTLFKTLFSTLNGLEEANIACSDETEIVEEILQANTAHPRTLLWSANVAFDASCTEAYADSLGAGLIAGINDSWADFQKARNLSPVSVFVSGTPGSGKTELAKSLAEKVGAKYIDRACCVMHVIKAEAEDIADAGLKTELFEVLEGEITKTRAPPKKGEEAIPVTIDPVTFDLTDALVAALPLPLQRRCAASLIRQDPLCARRGYVMDLWGTGLVNSWDELLEATSGPAAGAGAGSRLGPELVVEVQATTEALVAKLCESLGIAEGTLAKAPKDQQATVKALEEKLAAYTANMADIVYPEPPAAVEGADGEEKGGEGKGRAAAELPVHEFTKSHTAVLDMQDKAKAVSAGAAEAGAGEGAGAAPEGGDEAGLESQIAAATTPRFFRVNADTAVQEVVLRAVGSQILDVHGAVGWLSAEQIVDLTVVAAAAAAPAAEAEVEAASAVGDAVGEESKQQEQSAALAAEKAAPATTAAAAVASTQEATQQRIQKTLGECSEENKAILVDKTISLQKYLLQHVMPELAKGMVQIAQQRPADPIGYLADHLDALAANKESEAEMAALLQFNKLLAVAEGTWVEPEEAASLAESGESGEASVVGMESLVDSLEVASLEP